MKRLFKIFELSKNEQRVVLIIMLILITVALLGYERRVHSQDRYRAFDHVCRNTRPCSRRDLLLPSADNAALHERRLLSRFFALEAELLRQTLWWAKTGFSCTSEPGIPGRNFN